LFVFSEKAKNIVEKIGVSECSR